MSTKLEQRIAALRPLFVELRKARDIGVAFERGDLWGKNPPWEKLRARGDQRAAALEAVGRKLQTKPPRALVEVVRTFGYVSVLRGLLPKTHTPLILGWAEYEVEDRSTKLLRLDAKDLIHGPRGKKLHGMAFVNDPGDAPAHFYAYVEELPSTEGEFVWCYIGFDTAYPDGVRLAPIATDFVALILAVALGLTDVLLLPKKKAASQRRALKKVAEKRSDLYRAAINDIERSLELSVGAEIYLAKKAEYDPSGSWTLERGREAIRERLDEISL
jgi:hypothetical protein